MYYFHFSLKVVKMDKQDYIKTITNLNYIDLIIFFFTLNSHKEIVFFIHKELT